jgi:hypothetical protein
MRIFCPTIPIATAVMAMCSVANLNAAGTWDAVASEFECVQKVQEGEHANGSIYQMEYIPRNEKLGSHGRIFTITLTRLPQDETAANEQADRSIKSIAASSARVATKMIEFNRYSTNHGPVAFFEYVVKGEHNIGVIARSGPGILAVYQLATLNQEPTATDRKRVRALVSLN